MKLVKHFLPLLILGVFLSGMEVQAQTKKTEKEKKEQLRKMEEEMKIEQLRMQEEIKKKLEENKFKEAEQLKSMFEDQKLERRDAWNHYQKAMEQAKVAQKLVDVNNQFIQSKDWLEITETLPEVYGSAYRGFYNLNRESTSLSISKELDDITFETQFKYEVAQGSYSFYFSANGSVEEGTIMIRLYNPAEELVHEFEVSPLADVKWSQTLKWDEDDEGSYQGTWTIFVSAEQATGIYNVNVRAN